MLNKNNYILLIGNSDGIGLKLSELLLNQNYKCIGLSRSKSPLTHSNYQHIQLDVTAKEFVTKLKNIVNEKPVQACIYLAGVGHLLKSKGHEGQIETFEVNIMAALQSAKVLIPYFENQKQGHFITISSVADGLTSSMAPAYSASKAAMTKYFEGLGLSITHPKIYISNIRFGFVDTKMAKAPTKPFQLSKDEAAKLIYKTLLKPKRRQTKSLFITPIVFILEFFNWLKIKANY